jgi:hypothetical protein
MARRSAELLTILSAVPASGQWISGIFRRELSGISGESLENCSVLLPEMLEIPVENGGNFGNEKTPPIRQGLNAF